MSLSLVDESVQTWLRTWVSDSRFSHSVRVAQTAQALAKQWNVNPEYAYFSGLLHDAAKSSTPAIFDTLGIKTPRWVQTIYSEYPPVWHAFSGPYLAKYQWGPLPSQITSAMRFHTTGNAHMTVLEQLLFIADFIEPGREHPATAYIRDLAFTHLDEAVFSIVSLSITHLIQKGRRIHPKSFACHDFYLGKISPSRCQELMGRLWETL
jgi:predicted HD superfamily hydrolase involved in NAD metabolism